MAKQSRYDRIEHFKVALTGIGVKEYDEERYMIIPTIEEENCKYMDDLYKTWDTPKFSGIRISFNAVIEALVKEKKKVAPLRIKISKEKGEPVILETSHRYRKLRDIAQRKLSNTHYPFEINEAPEFLYSATRERKEAIRVLFFTRSITKHLQQIIGGTISHDEVKANFEKHFEQYRYYPAIYDTEPGETSHSHLVIEKNFDKNEFRLFKNTEGEETIHSGLTFEEAMKLYMKDELEGKILEIGIVKNE